MNPIPFILCERAHRRGLEEWLAINYGDTPHCLWSGRTGSGKSVAAKLLLARSVLLAPPELQPVELTIIDPEEDIDFDYLTGLPRYHRGENAPQGFADFFAAFEKRKRKEDLTRNLKILFVDEFASMVSLIQGKTERETAQKNLGLLLSLSRSRNFSVQMATQQPSARIFGEGGSASRGQFGMVCLLGDSGGDDETLGMMFDGQSREQIKRFGHIGGRGVGWLSLNGGLAQPVRIPHIEDMDKLNELIYNNLAGTTNERGGEAKPQSRRAGGAAALLSELP